MLLLLLKGSHGRQVRMRVGMLMVRRILGIPRRNLHSTTTSTIAGRRRRGRNGGIGSWLAGGRH